ncbi:MAG: bifunctional adenosylcobinamide kinase/adenosylcobinamide-phosphate guanylyltransferase [Lachnospiraceae bacterium]
MIFIIGGSCQGKTAFARALYPADSQTGFEAKTADGSNDDLLQAYHRPVILRFHHYLSRLLEQELDTEAFTRKVLAHNPEIIVMNEVGYGIVPIDRSDRSYREAVGRAGQMLAAEAEAVYRVICGIGTRIK